MNEFHGQPKKTVYETLMATLPMLGFGLAILAFLVAIERPHWFVLRPASGTAAAMAKASEPPARNIASLGTQVRQRADTANSGSHQ